MADESDSTRWAPALRWCLATRRELDRWEALLAKMLLLELRKEKPPGTLIWETRMEHHFLLVAGDNLRRALNRVKATGFLKDLHQDIELLRHLHEHWDNQEEVFANVASPGPLNPTGAAFHDRHPGRSPYGFFNWNSKTGPEVGPGVLASSLRGALDHIEAAVVKKHPELSRFIPPRPASPWISDPQFGDDWWPKPMDGPT